MAKLTKAEKAWVKKLVAVLNECPSERIGAYTIGDSDISLYDRTYDARITEIQEQEGLDFCLAVDEMDASLGNIKLPFSLHSTAG